MLVVGNLWRANFGCVLSTEAYVLGKELAHHLLLCQRRVALRGFPFFLCPATVLLCCFEAPLRLLCTGWKCAVECLPQCLTAPTPRGPTPDMEMPRFVLQLGKKVNKSPLKFSLSLVSACVTLLMNGDEDINPNVSAWVFPLMLVCGGLVMLADSKARPQNYTVTASTKSESLFVFVASKVY